MLVFLLDFGIRLPLLDDPEIQSVTSCSWQWKLMLPVYLDDSIIIINYREILIDNRSNWLCRHDVTTGRIASHRCSTSDARQETQWFPWYLMKLGFKKCLVWKLYTHVYDLFGILCHGLAKYPVHMEHSALGDEHNDNMKCAVMLRSERSVLHVVIMA